MLRDALIVAAVVVLALNMAFTVQTSDKSCETLRILHDGIATAYERDRLTDTPQAKVSARRFKAQLDAWPSECR